jgi:hypothetical protein
VRPRTAELGPAHEQHYQQICHHSVYKVVPIFSETENGEFDMRAQELEHTERGGRTYAEIEAIGIQTNLTAASSWKKFPTVSKSIQKWNVSTSNLLLKSSKRRSHSQQKSILKTKPTLTGAELPVPLGSQEPRVSTKHAFTQTTQSKVYSLRVVAVATTSPPPKLDVRGGKHTAIEKPQPSSQSRFNNCSTEVYRVFFHGCLVV